jgi:hypothetical protein
LDSAWEAGELWQDKRGAPGICRREEEVLKGVLCIPCREMQRCSGLQAVEGRVGLKKKKGLP